MGAIHTSQAALTAAAGAHRRRGRSRGADATPHPTRPPASGKGSQQRGREEGGRTGERAREEGKGGKRRSTGTGKGRRRLGPGAGGRRGRCGGGGGTGTTTTLRAQVAELAPTNPSARHAPTRGFFSLFLPRLPRVCFPPPAVAGRRNAPPLG